MALIFSKAICVDDLKQFVLGLSTLYSGASAFLVILLKKCKIAMGGFTGMSKVSDTLFLSVQNIEPQTFDESWKAQYGDGTENEFYTIPINPVFIGRKFTDVAWVCN